MRWRGTAGQEAWQEASWPGFRWAWAASGGVLLRSVNLVNEQRLRRKTRDLGAEGVRSAPTSRKGDYVAWLERPNLGSGRGRAPPGWPSQGAWLAPGPPSPWPAGRAQTATRGRRGLGRRWPRGPPSQPPAGRGGLGHRGDAPGGGYRPNPVGQEVESIEARSQSTGTTGRGLRCWWGPNSDRAQDQVGRRHRWASRVIEILSQAS